MFKSDGLTNALKSATEIPYDDQSKFVIMSDCHRGDGDWADNFSNNQNLFFAALNYYYTEGFTYIELGDGDELWENRDFKRIISIHSDAFWLMSKYYKDNRLFMLYGNHDMIKRSPKYLSANCSSYYDEGKKETISLFPNLKVHEGLVIKHSQTGNKLFLAHGHQVDFLNHTIWKLARFLVRYVWKPLELIGVHDPTSAAKNYDKKIKIEKTLMKWSRDNKLLLIAGHTHRPVFPKLGEPLYFNDGSCVHPRCITALEIENDSITLVKWTIKTKKNRVLFVGRVVLEGPVKIVDFYNHVN